MSADDERLDTLLALAITFSEREMICIDCSDHDSTPEQKESGNQAGADSRVKKALESLSALSAADYRIVEQRLIWYEELAHDKQVDWLRHMLDCARAPTLLGVPLDEHIHSSQIVEALRLEPHRTKKSIFKYLPPHLRQASAAALGMEQELANHIVAEDTLRFVPEIAAVIYRAFASQFVTIRQLKSPTKLDLLSRIELAELVRLVGTHETAIACRGVPAVESVASFLRRFSRKDAHAIAGHLATLADVELRRMSFAENSVHAALNLESEPGAMLDQIGIGLLAMAMAECDLAALVYTSQKLPIEAAKAFHAEINESRDQNDLEMTRCIIKEIEALVAGIFPRPVQQNLN